MTAGAMAAQGAVNTEVPGSSPGRSAKGWLMADCIRCGYADEAITKRVERGGQPICNSCAARPAQRVQTKYGTCRPHRGLFDNFDNPLDPNGSPYRPGVRLCGNSDCIERSHIVKEGNK